MIVNDNRKSPAHVEFVGYTGRWPALCSGVLTLRICGEEHKFGDEYKLREEGIAEGWPKFWSTGGHCGMPPDGIEKDEWHIDVDAIPERFRKYAEEIDAAFNKNVEHGCCGGCR